MDAEVLVVGGGIGGAVLALGLGRAGRSVVVLERESQAPPTRRPEILWPPTLESLDALSVGARVRREAAVILRGIEIQDTAGERLLRISDEDFEAAGVRMASTDPSRTRELLLEAALATGRVELLRGVTVGDLERDERSVHVRGIGSAGPVERRGLVVIGDDGIQSRVRQWAGIRIETVDMSFEILGAVVPKGSWSHGPEARIGLDPSGLRGGVVGVAFVLIPGDRLAMIVPIAGRAFERLVDGGSDAFRRALSKVAPIAESLTATLRFPEDVGRFRRPIGHARTYVVDRVAILGDAAHPVTPAGGQGANMAIADAVVLCRVLLECLARGDVSASALAPYETARREANERSIAFSRRARQAFKLGGLLPPMRAVIAPFLRNLDRNEERKRRLIQVPATAFTSAYGVRHP